MADHDLVIDTAKHPAGLVVNVHGGNVHIHHGGRRVDDEPAVVKLDVVDDKFEHDGLTFRYVGRYDLSTNDGRTGLLYRLRTATGAVLAVPDRFALDVVDVYRTDAVHVPSPG